MKRIVIGLCGFSLMVAAGLAGARECRKPGPQEGSYDGGRAREAAYIACERRRERARAHRQARRTANAPIDQSANAPPPKNMVLPMQSK